MYRVSADIGGTFTDIVLEDTSNKNIKTIKSNNPQSNWWNTKHFGIPKNNFKK